LPQGIANVFKKHGDDKPLWIHYDSTGSPVPEKISSGVEDYYAQASTVT
jgi:hypothetical protein